MRFGSLATRPARAAAVVLASAACTTAATPAPASALNPVKPICGAVGWVSGLAGKACSALQHGNSLLKAGRRLLTGHAGGAAKALLGGGGGGGVSARAAALVGLAATGAWVLGGARVALHETATVLARTTSPQLGTTWFSSTYWRMAGISALLTLPFLFAATVQALLRSDLALLARAALGYLPLSLIAVSVAAPLTMLLLAASDQLSAIVSSAAGDAGTRFLTQTGRDVGVLSVVARSPFLAFLVGLLTAAAAIALWVEMLMREAAVYIVVLTLPLAFAALVWPARRIWAIRAVELLVALILSKFAIVAVLALGGAALGQRGAGGVGGMLAGLVLVVLGAFAPWTLLRLLPLAELASGAAGPLRGEAVRLRATRDAADTASGRATDFAGALSAGMRRHVDEAARAAPEPHPTNGTAAELTKLTAVAGAANGGAGGAASADGAPALDPEGGAGGGTPGGDTRGGGAPGGDTRGGGTPGGDADAPGETRGGGGGRAPGSASGGGALAGGATADDMISPPLVLGLDEGWPPKRPWPHGDDAGPESAGDPGTGDDPDPTPPQQDPEDGRL